MKNIVKITTSLNPLNLIAPHPCRGCGQLGDPLCICCKKYLLTHSSCLCPNCKNPTNSGLCPHCPTLPPSYNLGKREGIIDLLIHEYKYNSVRALAPILADLCNHVLPPLPEDTILVPLPTATQHIRSRGFDHTLKIAKHLSRLRAIKLSPLLIRTQNTVQVGSDKTTRLLQAEQAFSINPKFPINPNATYLIFDDVWTTGASIKSAIKKLQQAGANHFIILLLAVSSLD